MRSCEVDVTGTNTLASTLDPSGAAAPTQPPLSSVGLPLRGLDPMSGSARTDARITFISQNTRQSDPRSCASSDGLAPRHQATGGSGVHDRIVRYRPDPEVGPDCPAHRVRCRYRTSHPPPRPPDWGAAEYPSPMRAACRVRRRLTSTVLGRPRRAELREPVLCEIQAPLGAGNLFCTGSRDSVRRGLASIGLVRHRQPGLEGGHPPNWRKGV
jgi:hypothetical protein